MFLTQVDDGLIENITIEEVITKVARYNIVGIPKIREAYELAESAHKNILRESGEPYITHPLSVAYTLACLGMDTPTIIAGLLHDVVEDTPITLHIIEKRFGSTVAMLVDGVTKLGDMPFATKDEEKEANLAKILLSVKKDIRIIIIKLADKLHNMRTLQYKKREDKRVENALETLDLYAPIADRFGIYRMKTELEDLGFKYSKPDDFKRIYDLVKEEKEQSKLSISIMLESLRNILDKKNCDYEIKERIKNIYGVYKRFLKGAESLSEVHDLVAFKILVDDIDLCYSLLRPIHELYNPLKWKIKDYICLPKSNNYQSLHTTVYGTNVYGTKEKLVQMQLRTFEMDRVDSLGITAYLENHQIDARDYLKKEASKYSIYEALSQMAFYEHDNKEFVERTMKELLSENIYVSDEQGNDVELPFGSTIIDYAYKKGKNIGDYLVSAKVNEKEVDIESYILKDGDRIILVLDNTNIQCKKEWRDIATTTTAKKLMKI